jgi:cyclophilin family peptidyl-prolyl cis-trans isomerase
MLLLLLVLAFSFLACNTEPQSNQSPAANKNAPAAVPTVKPEPDPEVAVFETADYGRIVVELYPNIAPKMVERFKTLIKDKFYDGTAIHRIDPGLGIIQGGDPNTKGSDVEKYGMGDSKYPSVPAEFSAIPYERGTLGAARQNDINTANCQFFITLKRQPAFDKRYTVFGKVIDGIKNAEVIMGAPVAPGTTRPQEKIVFKSVTLQPRAKFPSQ